MIFLAQYKNIVSIYGYIMTKSVIIGELQEQLAGKDQLLLQRDEQIRILKMQVEQLRHQIYGASSERHKGDDRQMALSGIDAMAEDLQQPLVPVVAKKKSSTGKKRGPKPFPAHLERVEIAVADPSPQELRCPVSGRMMQVGFTQSMEILSKIPARYIVNVYTRNVFVSDVASELRPAPVASAWPANVLPKMKSDISIVSDVMVKRFVEHMPYARQQGHFERLGLELSRSTMVHWARIVSAVAEPLIKALWQKILDSPYVQLDATPVPLMDPGRRGRTREGCIWAYRGEGGTRYYDFAPRKNGETVKERFGAYRGILHTDGANNFGGVPGLPGMVHLECWVHARRNFIKAERLGEIGTAPFMETLWRMYHLERVMKKLRVSAQTRLKARQKHSKVWALGLLEQARIYQENSPLRKTALASACSYLTGHSEALLECFEYGETEIDTNQVENSIRPLKLGAKNWMFIGHPDFGPRDAALYTVMENCLVAGVNPEAYLIDILPKLANGDYGQIEQLLPQNWKLSKNTP